MGEYKKKKTRNKNKKNISSETLEEKSIDEEIKIKEIKTGDIFIYIPTGEKIQIIKVYKDSLPPYYLIRMQNGREKQTIIENLKKIINKDSDLINDKSFNSSSSSSFHKGGNKKITSKKQIDNNICQVNSLENPDKICKTIDFCHWDNKNHGNECVEISTDKSLEKLADKRGKVSDGFLKILKETAIDCMVFQKANEKDLKCYRPELPANYLKKSKKQKKPKLSNIFLHSEPDTEINCLKLQKKECQ